MSDSDNVTIEDLEWLEKFNESISDEHCGLTEYIIKAADWAIDCNGGSLFKDAEEIVRCRDCRHYHSYQDLCERLRPGMVVMGDGFCAWACRKGVGDD